MRLLLCALVVREVPAHAASEPTGGVTFSGQPVPGATVVAVRDATEIVTATGPDGVYRLPDLADGVWTLRVEMLGFATLTREVALPSDASPLAWELRLLSFGDIAGGISTGSPAARPPEEAAGRAPAAGTPGVAPPSAFPETPAADRIGAADGLLINGSVNDGAASPFAQPRAFGNNRPGQRSLYTGMIGALLGNSAWDARPFSFTGRQAGRPAYEDTEILGTFGGPIALPWLRNRANFFVGYQHAADTNALTQPALMPTARERGGDFSQTRDPLGRPIEIVDPVTGRPFPGNVIPPDRISPQAAALLGYYPQPDLEAAGRFNYQAPVVTATRRDSLQARLVQPVSGRSQLLGTTAYQRTTTDATTLFGFEDATIVSALDAGATWSYRLSPFASLRLGYQLTRLTSRTLPYFSHRTNASGDAGITGSDQTPVNWGPPSLTFSSGVAGLSDALYGSSRDRTHGWSAESYWRLGRHGVTFGGDVRLHRADILSQQDPRGSFTFNGGVTGSDFADFLLGLPATSSIALGNPDKWFRARSYDGYITDDWRIGPALTLNVGVRWEYEAPIAERFGRLVNLDVAPGFAAVSPVVADAAAGSLTGRPYPASLVRPDRTGLQPRLAVAWRPVAGSSLVIRAGYGIYRNTNVYRSIATLLAQQPPLSTTFSVERSAANPLTLATGLAAPGQGALNTFAVDPGFQVGYAHNWQISMQRDLPASLTVIATYLGSKGSRLMQEFLPNTYPPGADRRCPACPSGFVYLTSGGRSLRNAGQVQLRRRLRNGLSATVQYTLAKATDDAAAFGGAALGGAVIAQDWLDLEAEYARSGFDQRHLVTAQVEYTTGAGITGGTLIDGWKGRLFKDLTFSAQLATGSGLPFTPVYLTTVPGTGVVGTIRAARTGADPDTAPDGYYLNPAAFARPEPGRWGSAGRNSVAGPAQFSLDASIARTFRVGDRLSLDWRIDATNVLNQVTFASVNALVTSPQFGLPDRPNTMRRLRSSLRLRF